MQLILPKRSRLSVCAAVLLAIVWLAAPIVVRAADDKPNSPIAVELSQSKVAIVDGKELVRSASEFAPGDVIEYVATYTNRSDKPVRNVRATLPVPEGLIYVPFSAFPKDEATLVAAEDGKYAPEPLMRADKAGEPPKPLPYDEYRSVRWVIDRLDPGATVKVKARARLAPIPSPVEPAATAHQPTARQGVAVAGPSPGATQ